jgi:uncharacterized protein YqeY
MNLHQTIKDQIKDALRAKDTVRLDTLRGLNSLAQNELMAAPNAGEFLADDKMLALIKRSVKQRKDSIDQFQKGGREDLVAKEKAELKILDSFMPAMMSYEEIKVIVHTRVATLKSQPGFDPKTAGKIVGQLMKELAGKADGADVKKAVDETLKA